MPPSLRTLCAQLQTRLRAEHGHRPRGASSGQSAAARALQVGGPTLRRWLSGARRTDPRAVELLRLWLAMSELPADVVARAIEKRNKTEEKKP
jgi:hypothetical protein